MIYLFNYCIGALTHTFFLTTELPPPTHIFALAWSSNKACETLLTLTEPNLTYNNLEYKVFSSQKIICGLNAILRKPSNPDTTYINVTIYVSATLLLMKGKYVA